MSNLQTDIRDDATIERGVGTVSSSEHLLHTHISWGAVFAGVVIALGTTLLLNLLGLGIGISTVTPSNNDNPGAGTLSMAAGIWYVVASLIAAFAGGYSAARLSGRATSSTGGWHGLTTFAVTTMIVLYLLTTAIGSLIGGAFSTVTGAIGSVGSTAAAAGSNLSNITGINDPFGSIAEQFNLNGSNGAAAKDSIVSYVRGTLSGDQNQAAQAKDKAVQALAQAQNIPVADARAKIDQYMQQSQQTIADAKRKALDVADSTAKVVSRGSLLGFLALVLGAVAAWMGGRSGGIAPRFVPRDGRTAYARATA